MVPGERAEGGQHATGRAEPEAREARAVARPASTMASAPVKKILAFISLKIIPRKRLADQPEKPAMATVELNN